MTGLVVGGVTRKRLSRLVIMSRPSITPVYACRECLDTGWAYFKPDGCRPEWFPCGECFTCEHGVRHLQNDGCDCEAAESAERG